MAILTVGVGDQFGTLASAIAASHNGDTIEVAAGTYTNDFAIINDNITIEGVGGMANLVATKDPSNGKAILVTNGNDTIENVSFSGAVVADGNGAGIRYQKGDLTLVNDYFHNNQDGLLAAANTSGSITIQHSEFANNGTSSGQEHNLYVGEIGTLTVENSLFTGAIVGNEIQTRALNDVIENNRIQDGPGATSSYSINLPQGGNALIENNTFEKSSASENPYFIHFGGDTTDGVYASSSLTISDNTFVDDLHKADSRVLFNQDTAVTATVAQNDIYGLTASEIAIGPASLSDNTILTTEPTLSYAAPFNMNDIFGVPPSPQSDLMF